MSSDRVVIVGGGPAGSATAIALANASVAVTVLHRGPGDADHHGRRRARSVGEGLPAAARTVLERLGVWLAFSRWGHLRSAGTASAWGSDELAGRTSLTNPYGGDFLLDRAAFDDWLLGRAEQAGAHVQRDVEVVGVDRRGATTVLSCRRPGTGLSVSSVAAEVVIDATGRSSRIARALGAQRGRTEPLVAFAVDVAAPPGDIDRRILVEAAPEGWWYTSPVPGGRRVIVFLTDGDLPAARQARTSVGHHEGLRATRRVAAYASSGGPMPVPRAHAAATSWLMPTSGPGWYAVGDAVLAFDPLSSNGMIAALEGGCRVADEVRGRGGGFDRWVAATRVRTRSMQRASYALEQRWPAQPFWQRRHAGLGMSPDGSTHP